MTEEEINKTLDALWKKVFEPCNFSRGDKRMFYKGFLKGVQWRIDSVWHDKTEEPKGFKPFIALKDNKLYEVVYPGALIPFIGKIIRWAYIEDLLPTSKTE